MRAFKTVFFLFFALSANADEYELSQKDCSQIITLTDNFICLDYEVSDLDALTQRILKNLTREFELRHSVNDKQKFNFLRKTLMDSEKVWQSYRDSYCNIETLHLLDEDEEKEKNYFYKQCLLTVYRQHIDQLRVFQFNFRYQYLNMPPK